MNRQTRHKQWEEWTDRPDTNNERNEQTDQTQTNNERNELCSLTGCKTPSYLLKFIAWKGDLPEIVCMFCVSVPFSFCAFWSFLTFESWSQSEYSPFASPAASISAFLFCAIPVHSGGLFFFSSNLNINWLVTNSNFHFYFWLGELYFALFLDMNFAVWAFHMKYLYIDICFNFSA